MTSTPKYAYVIAVVLGLAIFFFPGSEYSVMIFAIVYLVAGGLFGYIWPAVSWKWGLWMAGPVLGMLAISVLFSGQLDSFILHDLPYLAVPLVPAAIGGLVMSKWKLQRS